MIAQWLTENLPESVAEKLLGCKLEGIRVFNLLEFREGRLCSTADQASSSPLRSAMPSMPSPKSSASRAKPISGRKPWHLMIIDRRRLTSSVVLFG
jgi:hypothetical protein